MNRTLIGLKAGVGLLAASLLAVGTAQACSVAAWTASNTTAVGADSGGPAEGIRRYMGLCGLDTDTVGKVVAENSPENESIYRARFYFFPEITGGSAKIFSATASDNGAGGEVVGLSYNSNGTLSLLGNGSSVATVSGLTPGAWYGVEITYRANTELSMAVRGRADAVNGTAAASSGIPTGNIGSHTLGFVTSSGATGGGFQIDEFEASRSADTAIGFRARGDAAAPFGTYDLQDIISILREARIGAGAAALGNSDADEDGDIDLQDIIAVLRRVRSGSF
jgi:hypothetical protein